MAPLYQPMPFSLPLPPLLKAAGSYRLVHGFGQDSRLLSALFSWISDAMPDSATNKRGLY